MTVLNSAIEEACEENDYCDFFSITHLFGDSDQKWLPSNEYDAFLDTIHLQERGYCAVINATPVQMALGCDMIKRLSTPYDCTDKYMWIWIVAGVGGAAAIGLIVYAVMAFIEMGEDGEAAAIEG